MAGASSDCSMSSTPAASSAAPAALARPEPMRLLAPLLVFAALAVLFLFGLRSGDPSRLPSALIGRPAPSIDLPALEDLTDAGKAVPGNPLERPKPGEVTVVNFWASWCAPCLQEHPQLMALVKLEGVHLY